MKAKQSGFTLIELMMVVAIIGVLASIALPSYQAYVYRAKAVEVVEVLDKLHTVLAGFQSEKGMIGSQYCVHSDSQAAGDTPGVFYDGIVNTKEHGVVSGITAGEMTLTHQGLRLFVGSCVSYMSSAGQYSVIVHPIHASDIQSRQLALAVRHVMQSQAYRTSVSSSGAVYLYFQL